VALQLMFRSPCNPALGRVLSPLAREELRSISSGCWPCCTRRGIPLRPAAAAAHGALWPSWCAGQEPGRMLDSFLVAGLIEDAMATSASPCCGPPIAPIAELAALYATCASEAPFTSALLVLCERRWPRSAVIERLEAAGG